MAIRDGFPSASGVVDPLELRLALAALVVRDAAGAVRAGIAPRNPDDLVTERSDMKVDVAAFEAVLYRQGALFIANDGTDQVTIPTAPGSNSRYDIVWAKQNDNVAPNADGSNSPVFGVTSGAAAPSPNKATALAAIPVGAMPLAAVLVPSGASATNAVGVVITQEFPYTCTTGGALWFRNTTERDAFDAAPGQLCYLMSTDQLLISDGTAWASVAPPDGMTPIIPTGVLTGSGSAGVGDDGTVTLTSVGTYVTFLNCFAGFDNVVAIIQEDGSANFTPTMQLANAAGVADTADYHSSQLPSYASGSLSAWNQGAAPYTRQFRRGRLEFFGANLPVFTTGQAHTTEHNAAAANLTPNVPSWLHGDATAFPSLKVLYSTGTVSGKWRFYGWNDN